MENLVDSEDRKGDAHSLSMMALEVYPFAADDFRRHPDLAHVVGLCRAGTPLDQILNLHRENTAIGIAGDAGRGRRGED